MSDVCGGRCVQEPLVAVWNQSLVTVALDRIPLMANDTGGLHVLLRFSPNSFRKIPVQILCPSERLDHLYY